MDLREEEQIQQIYHHHLTPFIFIIIKSIIAIFPFFLVLFLFQDALSSRTYIILHAILLIGFTIVLIFVALDYWLDKLVVTNQRIILINWQTLLARNESEAFLHDIQDIQTKEKGFLANFKIFDYGLFKLETASSQVTIMFDNAPDPEGIRRFVYHLRSQVE